MKKNLSIVAILICLLITGSFSLISNDDYKLTSPDGARLEDISREIGWSALRRAIVARCSRCSTIANSVLINRTN